MRHWCYWILRAIEFRSGSSLHCRLCPPSIEPQQLQLSRSLIPFVFWTSAVACGFHQQLVQSMISVCITFHGRILREARAGNLWSTEFFHDCRNYGTETFQLSNIAPLLLEVCELLSFGASFLWYIVNVDWSSAAAFVSVISWGLCIQEVRFGLGSDSNCSALQSMRMLLQLRSYGATSFNFISAVPSFATKSSLVTLLSSIGDFGPPSPSEFQELPPSSSDRNVIFCPRRLPIWSPDVDQNRSLK